MALFTGVETSSSINELIYILASRATDNSLIITQLVCLSFAKFQLFGRE